MSFCTHTTNLCVSCESDGHAPHAPRKTGREEVGESETTARYFGGYDEGLAPSFRKQILTSFPFLLAFGQQINNAELPPPMPVPSPRAAGRESAGETGEDSISDAVSEGPQMSVTPPPRPAAKHKPRKSAASSFGVSACDMMRAYV